MTGHVNPDTVPRTSGLFEITRTTRSMRRLKPDPVPNELIRKIVEAGVCAPSGGNMQRWRFLVIRDAGRGAYRRYKDLLVRRAALERWYDFSKKSEEADLREWCAENGHAVAIYQRP